MNRKQFIQSVGGDYDWPFAWSFVREATKTVIFPAWDVNTDNGVAEILSERWNQDALGNASGKYTRAREHLRFVEQEGWELQTFQQIKGGETPKGTWKIGGIVPQLKKCGLVKVGDSWFAVDPEAKVSQIPEEEESPPSSPSPMSEGGKVQVTVNAWERSPEAREACVKHHGATCTICGFNFGKFYGAWGEGYIHAHHLIPVSERGGTYVVDPINDMVPVCANCHSMIHRRRGTLSLDELRALVATAGPSRSVG